MRSSFLITFSAFALVACSGDDAPAPSSSSTSSTSSSSSGSSSGSSSSGASSSSGSPSAAGDAEVDLTFTGAIDATLKGTAGTCGGLEGGFSVTVRSEDLGASPKLELAVVILGEEDWATPPTVVNEKEGARRSFGWDKKTGTVVAARDRSRVDFAGALLKNVVAAETITLTGSVVCKKK